MGILSGIFGKRVAEAKTSLKKIENKDFMEAIVAACILVAWADGDCSEAEMKSMEDMLRSNDALKHFDSEISQTVSSYDAKMRASKFTGKMLLLREISDVKADANQKEEVFLTALTIASADGDISDAEAAILKEIGNKFGLSLKDYGLAA